MSAEILAVGIFVMGGIFSVLWYLLRQKDAHQEEQIKLLFKKHDDDASALQELRLQIAEGHYKKGELDAKFERLDTTIRDSFKELGGKFDELSKTLIAHVGEHRS